MKMKITTVLVSLTFFGGLLAQPPDTLWTKVYGGQNNYGAHSILQTQDEGYIAVGYTSDQSGNNDEIYIMRTNSFGDSLWTKTYGGNKDELVFSIMPTSDNRYIIAGYSNSYLYDDDDDIIILKINSNGDTLWTKTYGDSVIERSRFARETSDGGIIIVGYKESLVNNNDYDVYLIRTNNNGDTLWTKTIGGNSRDLGVTILQLSDGGYIILGATESFGEGGWDVYLIRINSLGDTLWTKTYGGPNYEEGYAIQQTSDGGFVISGNTDSYGVGNLDFYLIKTNSNGDTLWTKTYGGSNDDIGFDVKTTQDKGYAIIGFSNSFSTGDYDVYLIKTDSSGNTLWTQTYGWQGDERAYEIQLTADNGYIIPATTESFFSGRDAIYLVRIQSDLTNMEDKFNDFQISSFYVYQNFPNPFNPMTRIQYATGSRQFVRLRVYDLLGKEISTLVNQEKPAGAYTVEFDASNLSSGIYFYQLQAGDFTETKKMILMR